jgi:hypothetical protein
MTMKKKFMNRKVQPASQNIIYLIKLPSSVHDELGQIYATRLYPTSGITFPFYVVQLKPPEAITSPNAPPAYWNMIIINAKVKFRIQFSDPSLKSIPNVTAGLKCPPLTLPKIYISIASISPAAWQAVPLTLLQLMAIIMNAVPMNS